MKTKITVAVLVILGIAAIVLYSSAYVVEEGKQVIVTQFGKPVDDVQEAGLHFKTPFIQEAYYLEKRILPWDGCAGEHANKRQETDRHRRLGTLAHH